MKYRLLLVFILLNSLVTSAQEEVFYHVFQRSFFDSDGDGHGDINGIHQKLDYLQDLGANTLLLTPLYVSDFYHNYFATDFEGIDPKYGSMDDYRLLVKEVHQRKMKIYQDVEMQYVAGKHLWFTGSYQKPSSGYSKYLYYHDDQNEKPFWFLNIPEFTTYDNRKQQIIVVDMRQEAVKEYTQKVLEFWMDPNGDGNFDDGVDGFRLDHMMDDLDNAGLLTNLFKDFWHPLLQNLKNKNPALKIIAEQADWASFGHDYFAKGNVDYVFGFRLKFALNSFQKEEIEKAADSTLLYNPINKNQLVFLENHDTKRWASEPGMTLPKAKAATAIQLLIGGIPSLYYGQEIGMKGIQQQFGMTDGNDIPVREAFDWYASGEGPGMALWYQDSGIWWDKRNQKANDGISLEEQKKDPNSLWNHYKTLLSLRKKHEELRMGSYEKITNSNPEVLSFGRKFKHKSKTILINLSDKEQHTTIAGLKKSNIIFGRIKTKKVTGKLTLKPYEVLLLE